jgi:hypothetical protein
MNANAVFLQLIVLIGYILIAAIPVPVMVELVSFLRADMSQDGNEGT